MRFESVNYRSKVWLNGKPIGKNRGAYLPFEIRLPAGLLKRGGVNHLVIRVDSRRKQTDFPPSGLSIVGKPTGGWWNYGGLLREVYLRKINDIDFNTVVVRPDLPVRHVPGDGHLPRDAAQLRHAARGASRVSARFGARRIAIGTRGDRRQALRHADQADQGRQAAPVVAGQPVPLRRVAGRPLGRRRSCSATR